MAAPSWGTSILQRAFELFGAVMKGGGDISVELEEANTQLTQELDEVENARVQLLKFAVKAMGTAEMLYPDVDADGAFTAGLAAELKETCSSVKAVTVKDRVLQVLDDPEAEIASCPKLDLLVKTIVYNGTDKKHSAKQRDISERALRVRESKRRRQREELIDNLLRMRDQNTTSKLQIMRSLDSLYMGTPEFDWNRQCSTGRLMSKKWAQRQMSAPKVKTWTPPYPYPTSEKVVVVIADNLEFRECPKFERHEDGNVKLEFTLVHTVNMELFKPPR